jgi:hypothetical protein
VLGTYSPILLPVWAVSLRRMAGELVRN